MAGDFHRKAAKGAKKKTKITFTAETRRTQRKTSKIIAKNK
jgi:hypothetical protein